MEKIKTSKVPLWLGHFERILAQEERGENGGSFLLGSRISVADIALFNILTGVYSEEGPMAADLSGFPRVAALKRAVGERPNISSWIKNRPHIPFNFTSI